MKIDGVGESKEALIWWLYEQGTTGITEESDNLTAYFDFNCSIETLKDALLKFRDRLFTSGLKSDFSFTFEEVADRDWNETWKKHFQPIEVGKRIYIIPPWCSPEQDKINIIIDPGMAFGTGHHKTTRRCIEIIEKIALKICKGHFLDIGTGTGIITIAAAKTGFANVFGIDIDPLAVDAARRNVQLNELRSVIISEGSLPDVSGQYDVISANLISETLIELAESIKDHLVPSGVTVLSGMLRGQEEGVIRAFESEGLCLLDTVFDDEWVTLIFSRDKPSKDQLILNKCIP